MPSSPRNRIGEVYGKLTVVRASERRTKAGNVYWWCRCSCGAEREVPSDKLSLNTARLRRLGRARRAVVVPFRRRQKDAEGVTGVPGALSW